MTKLMNGENGWKIVLVALGIISALVGVVFAGQSADIEEGHDFDLDLKRDTRALSERVTRNEANNEHILKALKRIEEKVERIEERLEK